MKLFFKYMSMHFKSQLEFKLSFILSFISQLMVISFSSYMVFILINKFGFLSKYNIYSVLLSISIVQFGFSFAECFGRGFDKMPKLIKNGNLDLLLVRPRNMYLQILGSNFEFSKFSRIIGSLVVFVYAICNINFNNPLIDIIGLIVLLIFSSFVYFALFIFGACFCFKTVEGLEFMNIFTDGSREFGQYPMDLFGKKVLTYFTFIVPIACVNYYPIMYIMGTSNNILYLISPIYSLLLLLLSIYTFEKCLVHYGSTGS